VPRPAQAPFGQVLCRTFRAGVGASYRVIHIALRNLQELSFAPATCVDTRLSGANMHLIHINGP
jgi:hypothetical protein